MTRAPRFDRIRRDLEPLRDREVVLYGSVVTDRFHARSDVDVALVTRTEEPDENRAVWKDVLGTVPERYDVRVFETLPLPIQVDIVRNHRVVFGDAVDLSYYFYGFRRRWADQAPRVRANRFPGFEAKRAALERARGEKVS